MKAMLHRNHPVLAGMHHATLRPELWHPSLIENISAVPLTETPSAYSIRLLKLRAGTFAAMAASIALLLCLPL